MRHSTQLRTSTKNNNANPTWNESFKLLVHDPENQVQGPLAFIKSISGVLNPYELPSAVLGGIHMQKPRFGMLSELQQTFCQCVLMTADFLSEIQGTFKLLPTMQKLTCILMDYDDFNPDDEIGRSELPIKGLTDQTQDFWLDVDMNAEGDESEQDKKVA